MMPRWFWLAGAALLLFAVASAAGLGGEAPRPGQATPILMAESLLEDGDLLWTLEDLDRAYRHWSRGPVGLRLQSADGGRTVFFGGSPLVAVAAAPFVTVFGAAGLPVLGVSLLLAMIAAGVVAERGQGRGGLLWVGAFFVASALLARAWVPEVTLLAAAFLLLPMVLVRWLLRRSSWGWAAWALLAAAGLSLGGAVAVEALLLPVALAPAVALAWRSLHRPATASAAAPGATVPPMAAPALVAVAALVVLTLPSVVGKLTRLPDTRAAARVESRSFERDFPLEAWGDPQVLFAPAPELSGAGESTADAPRFEDNPRVWWQNLRGFVVGRHIGFLPYFPFAVVALGLFLAALARRESRANLGALRVSVAVGLGLTLGATLLLRSHAFPWLSGPLAGSGGVGGLGNAVFGAVYPLFLLLPVRRPSPVLGLAGLAAVAVWTLPAVLSSLIPAAPATVSPSAPAGSSAGALAHLDTPFFRMLPLELPLLAREGLGGYTTRQWGGFLWVLPEADFFVTENHPEGVWIRGTTDTEVFLVRAGSASGGAPGAERAQVAFTAQAVSAQTVLTAVTAGDRLRLAFDSEGKRQGTPVVLDLGAPVARNLEVFFDRQPETYYRLRLRVAGGLVPASRFSASDDRRYLGVFLRFAGDGSSRR